MNNFPTIPAPWQIEEEEEYIPENPQTVSFELLEDEFDVTVEYDYDEIREVASIAHWIVTDSGRVSAVDWHETGLAFDEICELIEDLVHYDLGLEVLWL